MSRAECNTANVIDGLTTRDDIAALRLMSCIQDRFHRLQHQARRAAGRPPAQQLARPVVASI